jgi:hypothetical protein
MWVIYSDVSSTATDSSPKVLANMIVNETLPIIADPVLGGGVQSVVVSTVLIVIFSEIIPQSLFTRHGLYLGAKGAALTRVLILVLVSRHHLPFLRKVVLSHVITHLVGNRVMARVQATGLCSRLESWDHLQACRT